MITDRSPFQIQQTAFNLSVRKQPGNLVKPMRQGGRFIYNKDYVPAKDPTPPASPRLYKFAGDFDLVSENVRCMPIIPNLVVRERPAFGKNQVYKGLVKGKVEDPVLDDHLTTKSAPLKSSIKRDIPARVKVKATKPFKPSMISQRTYKREPKSLKPKPIERPISTEESLSPKKTVTWSEGLEHSQAESDSEEAPSEAEEVSMSPRYSENSEEQSHDKYDDLEDEIQQQRQELMRESLLKPPATDQARQKTFEELENEIMSIKNLLAEKEEEYTHWSESDAPDSNLSYSVEESEDERMAPRHI